MLKNKFFNLTLIVTLFFMNASFCMAQSSLQPTILPPVVQSNQIPQPDKKPIAQDPAKILAEQASTQPVLPEQRGFKYSIIKFLLAMAGVLISAFAIFLGLKLYKNLILKPNKNEEDGTKETLESPKNFKEAINLFLSKTDK